MPGSLSFPLYGHINFSMTNSEPILKLSTSTDHLDWLRGMIESLEFRALLCGEN